MKVTLGTIQVLRCNKCKSGWEWTTKPGCRPKYCAVCSPKKHEVVKTCVVCDKEFLWNTDRESRQTGGAWGKCCSPTCSSVFRSVFMKDLRQRQRDILQDLSSTLTKKCEACKEQKLISEYRKYRLNEDGLTKKCNDCRKSRSKVMQRAAQVAKHNITLDQYHIMLCAQNELCAICKSSEKSAWTTHLSIDHDHTCCPDTGSCGKCVRGLLCSSCNRLLGYAHDDPATLKMAIEYLEGGGHGKN